MDLFRVGNEINFVDSNIIIIHLNIWTALFNCFIPLECTCAHNVVVCLYPKTHIAQSCFFLKRSNFFFISYQQQVIQQCWGKCYTNVVQLVQLIINKWIIFTSHEVIVHRIIESSPPLLLHKSFIFFHL